MKSHPFLRILTWFALSLLSVPGFAAVNGPDSFGYTWADSDEPYVNITTPGFTIRDNLRLMGFTGDESTIRVALPAPFPFYGVNYNAVWVSSNGFLTFVNPANPYPTPANVPTAAVPNAVIAWMWDDMTLETATPAAWAGPLVGGGGFVIAVSIARKATPTASVNTYITLKDNGVIDLYYETDPRSGVGSQTVIGIENAAGTIGLPYMASGVTINGARPRAAYGVRYFPPGKLNCSPPNVTMLSCPTPPTTYSNAAGSNQVTSYNCVAGTFNGNEKVFRLDISTLSNVTVNLTNTDGRNRRLFWMATCSEFSGCQQGGVTQITRNFLPPGTYYVVVDGVTAADNGNFTLEVQCNATARPAMCGQEFRGETLSGTSLLTTWNCTGSQPGPENIYEVTVPAGARTLQARLSNKSASTLNVLIVDRNGLNSSAPSCLVADPDVATIFDVTPGAYYVVVESTTTAGGTYDLKIECSGPKVVCPSPPTVIDIQNPTTVFGDTTASPSNVDVYACSASAFGSPGVKTGYTGGEDVYEFTLNAASVVSFFFAPTNPDMRVLILSDCYEGRCVMEGGCGENLQPGTYRLVVDGVNGARGPYSITPFVVPAVAYNKWWECPECLGCGSRQTDIRKKMWDFNSNNFCGTGCDFSMFAVVECGTEFHTPFYDVETYHMQIYDVLQQQYVTLTADNRTAPPCDVRQTGILISYDDTTCSRVPCPAANCGGGSDCRSNNRTLDVSFRSPNQEPICGIYRLDFLNWGGYVWELYANCSGDRKSDFYIYRDLCSALANYNPLPEVGIANVTVDNAQCGSRTVTGTITLENVGCLPAAGYEITVEQVSTPSNPKTYVVNLVKGQRDTIPYTYDYTMPRPVKLRFKVDPLNKTRECSENIGSIVQCGSTSSLSRQVDKDACPQTCAASADAGPPATICEGAAHTVDGSASAVTCTAGSTAQYRWVDGALQPIPGCDWSTNTNCTVPPQFLPPGSNVLTIQVRCWDGTSVSCPAEATTLIDVIPNVVPPPVANVLRAVKGGADVRLSWATIGSSPISAYRLFKDADERLCAGPGVPQPGCPAQTRTAIADIPSNQTTALDEGAISGPPSPIGYYQVVGVSCLGDLEGPYH